MKRYAWFLAIMLLFLCGCAEIKPPTPIDIIKHPWGIRPDIRIGMPKEEVIKYWGEPDKIEELGIDKWGMQKEKWTYFGRYTELPVSYKYLSITQVLYFDGDNLTNTDTEKQ